LQFLWNFQIGQPVQGEQSDGLVNGAMKMFCPQIAMVDGAMVNLVRKFF
jgi:hypothetical protein